MKYTWYMVAVIIISLILTNVTLKIMNTNNIWLDLLIYLGSAILCTAVFMLFDKDFRKFLSSW